MCVANIVLAGYLFTFVVNSQYMLKVIARYQIRFLNHKGDYLALLYTLVLISVFVLTKRFYHFEEMGPPIANYHSIVPAGDAMYSYYGLANPKTKEEKKLLEMTKNPLMSHFSFTELSKLLPYSDTSCPPNGVCSETLQAMIKMHMT